jgi:hypothetical protein
MHDFFNTNLGIQLIGFIALGFYVALFQVNSRIRMLTLKVCGALLFTAHFFLLGATTAVAMTLIGACRDSTYILIGKKRLVYVPIFFITVFTVAAILTWQGPISLLALAGMTFGTLAFWQTKPSKIRLFALFASSPWIVYDLISGSYSGMILEGAAIISNLVGIYRFDLSKRRGGLTSKKRLA